jgi:aspartyl-tRNA(Asn)/glutamyl-tRNA(Gln) amidotransferase subunit B
VERQQDILEEGGTVAQETRLYDSVKHETRPMRSKEEANDYRYFPDPIHNLLNGACVCHLSVRFV